MSAPRLTLPPWAQSLSARLLVLTVAFVMLAEVLIFAPSIARFRIDWLARHIDTAYLASLALEATPDQMIPDDLESRLLSNAGARAVVLTRGEKRLLLSYGNMPPHYDLEIDLSNFSMWGAIWEAFAVLPRVDNRIIRVSGAPSMEPELMIETLIEEQPMRQDMLAFGGRILALSVAISLITAGLVYLSLNLMLVRPMRRVTASMVAFRRNPEDPTKIMRPSRRGDEIGVAECELAEMQKELHATLSQRARLAALGTAVAKISHDLRNALATSMLMAEKLAASADTEVRDVAPKLFASMERAVYICEQTVSFAREGPAVLDLSLFTLHEVIEEAGAEVATRLGADPQVIDIDGLDPGLLVEADYDQLYRVFSNLLGNALEAGAQRVWVDARRQGGVIAVDIGDDGPGLPDKALKNLFVPFAASARRGGTGLGLAIARELARAHQGDLALQRTGPEGTMLRLTLPDHGPIRARTPERTVPAR